MKVCGVDLEVRRDKTTGGLGDNFGICNVGEGFIAIGTDVCKDLAEITMLHEVIEAINFYQDLELEHGQISALATGIRGWLVDAGIDLKKLESVR